MKDCLCLLLFFRVSSARFVTLASLGLDLADSIVETPGAMIRIGSSAGVLTDTTVAPDSALNSVDTLVVENAPCIEELTSTTTVVGRAQGDQTKADNSSDGLVTLKSTGLSTEVSQSNVTKMEIILKNSTSYEDDTEGKSDHALLDVGDYDYDYDFDYSRSVPTGRNANLLGQAAAPTDLDPLLITAWDVLLNYLKMPGGPAVLVTVTTLGKCRTRS